MVGGGQRADTLWEVESWRLQHISFALEAILPSLVCGLLRRAPSKTRSYRLRRARARVMSRRRPAGRGIRRPLGGKNSPDGLSSVTSDVVRSPVCVSVCDLDG